MPYPTCHHILENGYFCQSPALKKRDYCYFHQEFRARRMKMARARARGERWWLELPAIEDMRSCQAAITRVIEAIAAQLIEPAHAKLLLSLLRLSSSNFKARKAWEQQVTDYETDESFDFVHDYPGFESVHDLPEDLDLDADPLKVFPMPEPAGAPLNPAVGLSGSATVPTHSNDGNVWGTQSAPQVHERSVVANLGQILRDAETPIPGLPLEVTADEVEVWDIAEREGERAAQKRAAELERNRRRRERRLQRARYEELARNGNIQLAAEKLVLDQQRAAQAAAAQQQSAVAEPSTDAAEQLAGSQEMQASSSQPARKPPQMEARPEDGKAASGSA
jgi:hypothetical protein